MFGIPFFVTLPMFENYLIINYIDYINLDYMMIYYLLFQIVYLIFWFGVLNFLYKIILRMWSWFS